MNSKRYCILLFCCVSLIILGCGADEYDSDSPGNMTMKPTDVDAERGEHIAPLRIPAAPASPQIERRWDINRDRVVDIFDLVIVSQHFGEIGGPTRLDWDVNEDGMVDIFDLVLVGSHFGERYEEEKPIALPGLPESLAGYENWLKLNARPIPPRAADPHNGTKNVYVNQERAAIIRNDQQQFPYPDGTIVVKESIRPGRDFIGLIATMRKSKGSDPAHNDWKWIEYTRNGKDEPFREVARDAVCWGCHSGAIGTDYVFTVTE